jgi:hypothetical protein
LEQFQYYAIAKRNEYKLWQKPLNYSIVKICEKVEPESGNFFQGTVNPLSLKSLNRIKRNITEKKFREQDK